MNRIRAWFHDWFWGKPVFWCPYGHHFVHERLPWPQPTHISHSFCRECFRRWFDEI